MSILYRTQKNPWLPVLVFCLISIVGIYVHTSLFRDGKKIGKEDIYFTYVEGSRLIQGINPYERVLSGDMRNNDKYATYFPLFYLLSAGTQLAGLSTFAAWVSFWQIVFLGCALGIAYLVFSICNQNSLPWLGIFGVLFWLFNRWTLEVTAISHLDFLSLLLLLLSLSLVPRRFTLACLLFGLSLAVKQIAIIALPLYLIWAWQTHSQNRLKHLLLAAASIAVIPLLVSVPFLLWNAEGFIKSILFSATRNPTSSCNGESLDALFEIYGLPAKIPMLFLLGFTYALAWFRAVQKYTATLLVMITFICFNSVLFAQYMVWFLPFIPLAASEYSPATAKIHT